jgi:hypothetical protein
MQDPLSPTDKRITSRPDVLVRELRGESVLLDLASERYFGLDEVGTGMWRALTGSPSVEQAIALLLEEYDVPPDRLREDVASFVDTLSSAGLVDVRDA